MEIAQLCKSAYNNQLQQSIYLCHKSKVKVGVLRPVQQPGSYWDRSSELPLCHKRNMSQMWQVNTLWQSQS